MSLFKPKQQFDENGFSPGRRKFIKAIPGALLFSLFGSKVLADITIGGDKVELSFGEPAKPKSEINKMMDSCIPSSNRLSCLSPRRKRWELSLEKGSQSITLKAGEGVELQIPEHLDSIKLGSFSENAKIVCGGKEDRNLAVFVTDAGANGVLKITIDEDKRVLAVNTLSYDPLIIPKNFFFEADSPSAAVLLFDSGFYVFNFKDGRTVYESAVVKELTKSKPIKMVVKSEPEKNRVFCTIKVEPKPGSPNFGKEDVFLSYYYYFPKDAKP